jgi:aryl-alcohol dehydrogenase-like predicted oxidoreductase
MAELQDAGLVRAIGMSNYDMEDVERCHAQRPVDAIQTGLSLVDHLGGRDMIRRCDELGIAVTVYEPVASGVLTDAAFDEVRARWAGTVWEESAFFRRIFSAANADRCRAASDRVREIGRRLGVPAAQVAIAWVLRHPGVTAAIAGSRSVEHTAENVCAGDVDITSVLDELEALTH